MEGAVPSYIDAQGCPHGVQYGPGGYSHRRQSHESTLASYPVHETARGYGAESASQVEDRDHPRDLLLRQVHLGARSLEAGNGGRRPAQKHPHHEQTYSSYNKQYSPLTL